MEAKKLIYRDEIIGKRISRVFHFNVRYDREKEFQERLIVVELETGLRFAIQSENDVLDPVSGMALIYPSLDTSLELDVELSLPDESEKNFNSPIRSIVLPYGWTNSIGLILENGFCLHDGFSMWGNSANFYLLDLPSEDMAEIDLPI